jgi:HD superfamily phosphohydrolase YqeK
MSRVRAEIRDQLAERAVSNLERYYSLLRSTGEKGVEDLIAAIHASDFSVSKSARHHHYPSGTMEHCLGVYDLMSKGAEGLRQSGVEVKESDVILVALLHDVAQGKCPEWEQYGGHGRRSRAIVARYLPEVSEQVLEAINGHMHEPTNENLFWKLIYKYDGHEDGDAGTCPKGQVKISDAETVAL